MALARPISCGLIVAKVAVCSETSMNEKKQPRTNMMPRIHQRLVPTLTKAKAAGPGNPVLYAGSKTGRDGIHGASMASDAFDDRKSQRRPTVQARFYLSAETYARLQKQAAERGVKQSALVEEALQSALT